MNFLIFRDLEFWGLSDSTKEGMLQSQIKWELLTFFERGDYHRIKLNVLWTVYSKAHRLDGPDPLTWKPIKYIGQAHLLVKKFD